MDFTNKIGFNTLSLIREYKLDVAEEPEKSRNKPSRVYVRDAKAMAATPADVIEYPDAYVYVVDMPGIKPGEIKVQVDDDAVLVVSGERKRGKDKDNKDGVKYVRMERRVGKFKWKFSLPKYANKDAVSAVCRDGVLTVRVKKLPPPEPKRPKTIEVKVKLLPPEPNRPRTIGLKAYVKLPPAEPKRPKTIEVKVA